MKEISGTSRVLGLIGNPVRHTLSPVIHNTLSKLLGRDMVYVPFPVESDPVTAVKGAFQLGIEGMNVTVPYKRDVIPALTGIDPAAAAIGAVNTLVRTEKGFMGYNTDMPGLGRALIQKGISLAGKQVVILGAGGASRAAVCLAASCGADHIYILNRTVEKAECLAREAGRSYPGLAMTALALEEYSKVPVKPSVFIQCTSLGLKPEDGLPIRDDDFYRMAEYGYDLVYRPADTPFLKKLNSLGIPGDNGLSMLLYQGVIAYELWTGQAVPEDIVAVVRTELERAVYGRNILLAGYMGSGKTTVGKALAEKLGMAFLDTDEEIERREGRSIRTIFAEEGEEAFREMETGLLRELSASLVGTVVSTGGGIVLRRENRELMKATGRVFLLSASPEETFRRVKEDKNRPLLDSSGEEELRQRINLMLKERRAAYDAAADRVIETEGKTVEKILCEIGEAVE